MFTYDALTVSNAEIVAPNINKNQKNLELNALVQGFKTSETKDAILAVTGGSTKISAKDAPMILRAAAGILTAQRATIKNSTTKDSSAPDINSISAADINEMNNKFYGR